MYNNTNPAELYSGTTWELVTSDKYIRTGNTPLSTGGSNSLSIAKANLPNIKLKVAQFSISGIEHEHFIANTSTVNGNVAATSLTSATYLARYNGHSGYERYILTGNSTVATVGKTSKSGNGSSSASPYTEALGSGTALSIQPAYITLKFWKRLT